MLNSFTLAENKENDESSSRHTEPEPINNEGNSEKMIEMMN